MGQLLRPDWKFLKLKKKWHYAFKLHTAAAGSKIEKKKSINFLRGKKSEPERNVRSRAIMSSSDCVIVYSVYFLYCGQHQSYCAFQWSEWIKWVE